MKRRTHEQERIAHAAQTLLYALTDLVPASTVDYRVENAKKAARALAADAYTIKTSDYRQTSAYIDRRLRRVKPTGPTEPEVPANG
jgi:hypothetical protein